MPVDQTVLLGDLSTSPTSLWISPLRREGDPLVRRVEIFESQLGDSWKKLDIRPGVGDVVSARHGIKTVRARVEQVKEDLVTVFLLDWGVKIKDNYDKMGKIPSGFKLPRRCLSHRLVLTEKIIEDRELVELLMRLISDCEVGRLESITPSKCGSFVSGRLVLDLANFDKPRDQFGGLSEVCLNELVDNWQGAKCRDGKEKEFGATDIRERGSNDINKKVLIGTNANEIDKVLNDTYQPRDGINQVLNGTDDIGGNQFLNGIEGNKQVLNDTNGIDVSSDGNNNTANGLDSKSDVFEDECYKSDSNEGADTSEEISDLLCSGANNLGKLYTETVPDRLELRPDTFEARWGYNDFLVHKPSGGRGVRPCNSVSGMDWSGSLVQILTEKNITTSSRLQSIMWPVMTRLQSVVGVAGPSQGKTLGWILPLVSSLSEREQYRRLPPGQGPLAVVLCPGIRSVSVAEGMLRDVVTGARMNIKVVTACSGLGINDPSDFINGMDVLVTTAPRLLYLMDQKLTNLDRCCHLVLEEGDRLLPVWHQQVGQILLSWHRSKVTQSEVRPDQLVVLAERWNKPLEDFTRTFLCQTSSPVVVFANLLEACVYGGVNITPVFLSDHQEKINQLREMVIKRDLNSRLIICCRNKTTAENISLQLRHNVMLLHSELQVVDMTEAWDKWCSSPNIPLIVSDCCISSLTVGGADRGTCLIHWDLPTSSKTMFGNRFTFVRSLVTSIFEKGPAQLGQVHIFIGPEDAPTVGNLVPFLTRCGAQIPDQLSVFSSSVRRSRAMDCWYSGVTLCSQLSDLGYCQDQMSGRCQNRHFLHTQLDTPSSSLTGVISFLVLRVETPVRYWVRLNDETNRYQKLVLGLARHFSQSSSRQPVTNISKGVVVVMLGRDGIYRRCKVVRLVYINKGHLQKLASLEVFTLDDGGRELVNTCDIMSLPSHLNLEEFPAGATCVVVSGLIAPDQDVDWGTQVSMFVSSKVMTESVEREMVCRGRVVLHMAHTVWIDRCQVMVRQSALNRFVCEFETVQSLLEAELALPNEDHLLSLIQLSEKAGISRPEIYKESAGISEKLELEDNVGVYAFLQRDEIISVYMSECLSPSLFFLHKFRDVSSLDRLEDDLTDWAVKHHYPDYKFRPRVGEVLMVRLEDDQSYTRARVDEILGGKLLDTSSEAPRVEQFYKTYCLDSGMQVEVSTGQIGRCPSQFVTRLPFQAVSCCLSGVSYSNGDSWDRAVGDTLFDLSRDKESDEALVLTACVVDVMENNIYTVRLQDRKQDIARMLVEKGLAVEQTETSDSITDSNVADDSYNDTVDESDKSWTFEETRNWDLPNGVPNEVLDYKQIFKAAKLKCEKYVEGKDNNNEEVLESCKSPCRPVVDNSVACLSLPLTPLSVPIDLPALTLIENISRYETSVPPLTWGQDLTSLSLKITNSSPADLHRNRVCVKVEDNSLMIQVMDTENDDFRLCQTPHLKLQGLVVPDQTSWVVKAREVNIRLVKGRKVFWPHLTTQKYGWIRRDCNLGDFTDSEEEDVKVRPSKSSSQSNPPNIKNGKHYHPMTGEEILPETMWQEHETSSDIEQEELDFIKEKPLDFNPSIPNI